jgi:putative acetyltransferase
MSTPQLTIRLIEPGDNEALARVIKGSLEELDAAIHGTVYTDEATDHMSFQYQEPRSAYFVALLDGVLAGGSGIRQVPGEDTQDTCELQRMFLHSRARGKGIANLLMEKCLDFARNAGFRQCYLETMPRMKTAIQLYEKHGFYHIDHPMGNTGHFSCEVWMLKQL